MCAETDMDQRTLISLSPTHTVTVNNSAQIEFVLTPKNPKQEPSVVTLSTAAWKDLKKKETVQKINHHLEDKTNEEWMYHPKTKFVGVRHLDFGRQVALLTYSRKGYLQLQHCVYLNDKEWEILVENIQQLSQWQDYIIHLNEKRRKTLLNNSKQADIRPFLKTNQVTAYEWCYAPFEEGAPTPKCEVSYFTKHTALCKAEEVASTLREPLGDLTIVETTKDAPNALGFFMLLYMSVLLEGTTLYNEMICPGCRVEANKTDSIHMSYNGCKAFGRDIIKDYLGAVKKLIPDDFYKNLFNQCWKVLNMPPGDPTTLMDTLKTILSSKVVLYLEETVSDLKEDYPDMPETLLIAHEIDLDALRELFQTSLPTFSKATLDEV